MRVVRSKRAVLVGMAVLALFAFACRDSNSPTAPIATQSEPMLLPASSNQVADVGVVSDGREDAYVQKFWATAMGEPELVVNGDRQWIRLVVACRHSPEGPDTLAVFNFHGKHMNDGANLWNGAEFWAAVRHEGIDAQDRVPAYKVVHCNMPDAK